MIQGAINQLIGFAAAAKKADDIVQSKETRAASREQKAKERALQRARDKIQARYDQNKAYKEFVRALGNNQAPEVLKRIAFEASQNTPQVKLGGRVIDISRLSPEAQQALRGGNK